MKKEEIKDFCDMKAQLEPENEDIYKAIIKILEQEPCCNCIEFKRYAKEMGFEIEQEPKSEWEQDHEILKAYSDGANEVLDKIRAEINTMSCAVTSMKEIYVNRDKVINILDKYKGESEG